MSSPIFSLTLTLLESSTDNECAILHLLFLLLFYYLLVLLTVLTVF